VAVVDEALRVISLQTIIQTIEAMKLSTVAKKTQINQLFAVDIVKMATIHIKYMNFKLAMDKFP